MELEVRIERTPCCLQDSCSTVELLQQDGGGGDDEVPSKNKHRLDDTQIHYAYSCQYDTPMITYKYL